MMMIVIIIITIMVVSFHSSIPKIYQLDMKCPTIASWLASFAAKTREYKRMNEDPRSNRIQPSGQKPNRDSRTSFIERISLKLRIDIIEN